MALTSHFPDKLVDSLSASIQGLNLVDRQRRLKRWNKTSLLWCSEADTTRSTLNRFWCGKSIRRETFIAICEAIGVNWEEVAISPPDTPPTPDAQSFALPPKIAPIRYWVGRRTELDTLKTLLFDPQTRTLTIAAISVVGLAGIGKTTLASQLVRQLHAENAKFVAAAWESLRSATNKPPRFDSIIDSMLFGLSFGRIGAADIILEDYFQKTQRLLQLLKDRPCLLVLDNVETVLSANQAHRAGYFTDECAEYAWLFKQLAETEHQSKIIFTSRETLAELPCLQTHTFQLGGLDLEASVELLQSLNLIATPAELTHLAQRYEGHPKALELVAAVIHEDFQGQIGSFLGDRKWLLIRDLESLIEQAIVRLSPEEYSCLSQISVYQTSEYPLLSSGIAAQMPSMEERYLKENVILALKRRQLLDYDSERQSYQMHPLVQEKASYLLNSESKYIAHSQANRYFLSIAKPEEQWQELADIKPQLLAHYHACQALDWEAAAAAIAPIYQRLRHWSYFELIIDLYSQLLPQNSQQTTPLISSPEIYCDILCRLGITYEALGERQRGNEYLQQSLTVARQINDRKREVNALSYIGLNYETMGEFAKAIEYLSAAKLLVETEVDDYQIQYRIISQLGITYYSLGRYHAAIELFQESLQIARQHHFRQGEGVALGNLGDAYARLKQHILALEYSQQALAIANEINNPRNRNFALATLAQAYNVAAKLTRRIDYCEESIKLSQQCLTVAREINHAPTEGWALRNLGIAYRQSQDYQRSINCLVKAIELATNSHAKNKAGEGFYQLAITYRAVGDIDKSISHLQTSLQIFEEVGSQANIAMALLELAKSNLYTNRASNEAIQNYLLRAGRICQELQLPQAQEIQQLQLNLTES